MKSMLKLMFIVSIVCIVSSCNYNDEEEKTMLYSASKGDFEIIVDLKENEDNSILITRKLKYKGDQDIQIHHSNPLISVLVASRGSNIAHTFDSIGLKTVLKSNETITYSAPTMFQAPKGDSMVSVLASFECDGNAYSIPLEFEY